MYHVMARGVDGRDIYADDRDRINFLESLERIMGDSEARMLAYCLMRNHFHLAVQVGNTPLSAIMHRFLTGYVCGFNLRQNRVGHLFQGRHRAIICANEAYLATLIRYIHQNPVRAGLVSKVCDWPWSSARLHPDVGADDPIKDFNPWLEEEKEEIVDLKRSLQAPHEGLEELGNRISLEFGVSIGELRSSARRPLLTSVRSRLTKEAITRGHTLSAVAGWLQLSPSSVTRYSQHR
ncbi:MAG: transposase [Elusimicrobia bacterium]|nr:transposase [Elusimicrobiota bacterium]